MADNAERWRQAGFHTELSMYDGEVIPRMIHDNLLSLKTRRLRDDDIFICAYPKSGTHWVWEIVNMILAGKVQYAKHWQNMSMLECRSESELDEIESPRIIHAHIPPRFLPPSLWRKGRKVLFLERNPKDVFVSAFNQVTKQAVDGQLSYTGTWGDFLPLVCHAGLFSTWFDNVNHWHRASTEHPEVDFLYLKYEDLKKDDVTEIQKIAEFLEHPLHEATYREIAEACSFKKLKHVSEKEKDQTFHVKWNEGEAGYFRKGIVGDWKNYFTVAQSEMFDKLYEEKMKRKYPEY